MSKYQKDRNFTNFVHQNLAIPLIYNNLGWIERSIDQVELDRIDIQYGIDYVFADAEKKPVYVQERFRDEFYKNYTDATFRFRRDANKNTNRIESEFYKIKADYLIYGITNGKKFVDKRHTLTDFLKWVVLDIKFIQEKYKTGCLKITKSTKSVCWIENNQLCCPVNYNPDKSSSFVPFDIPMIVKLWGNSPILAQKGYLK